MPVLLRAIITLVAVLSLTPLQAHAQETGIPVPRADLSAGYVFMRDFTDVGPDMDKTDFPAGWYFSGAFNATTWFGVVGEVGGSYKNNLEIESFGYHSSTNARAYTFMGGARFFKKTGRIVPFAQFLAGAAHLRAKIHLTPGIPGFGDTITENATDFAIQPGGGVTIYLTNQVGVRLAGDYRTIIEFAEDDNDYTNEFRALVGFTLHWGGR